MAVPTWSQLTFLTGPQQTKAAEFAAYGAAYSLWKAGKGPPPNPGTLTHSQAKAADALLRDLGTLIGPAIVGIRAFREANRDQALADFETSNP